MKVSMKASKTASNLIPAGMQLAVLEKTESAESKSGSAGVQFVFFCPEHKRRVYETVWTHTSKGENWDRLQLFAKRLGVLDEDAEGDVELDLDPANGTVVVVDVQHDEFNGTTRERLSFAGVWPTDHDKVRDFVTRKGGPEAVRALCGASYAKSAADDLGDV